MKKKIIIIIVVLAVLGVVTYFIVKKVKQKNATNNNATKGSGSSSGSTPGTTVTGSAVFPLKNGSKGAEVKRLQQRLNNVIPTMLVRLTEDGVFGPKTETALFNTVGLKQLTQNQYNKFIQLTTGFVGPLGLGQAQIKQIQNA